MGNDPTTGGIRAYDQCLTWAQTCVDNTKAFDATTNAVTNANLNWFSHFPGTLTFVIFWLGKGAFALFVPVMAAYIAYAIADRPGLAPGFVAGVLATGLGGNPLGTSTGFLGAIVGGFIAGYAALWISRWAVPGWVRPLMPVVIIPLLSTIIMGILMVAVFATPISMAMTSMTDGLKNMSGGSLALLGIVLGLMMAFDMGGPVNKVAYTFATAVLGTAAAAGAATDHAYTIMAIVMAAGMTPPLGLALATVLRKKLFTESERENGKAGWLLGASFISEGAIPFAAADPLRVIPSIMVGSAVTGALVGFSNIQLKAPHGGVFAFLVVDNPLLYTVWILVGTAVTAVAVIIAKGIGGGAVVEE